MDPIKKEKRTKRDGAERIGLERNESEGRKEGNGDQHGKTGQIGLERNESKSRTEGNRDQHGKTGQIGLERNGSGGNFQLIKIFVQFIIRMQSFTVNEHYSYYKHIIQLKFTKVTTFIQSTVHVVFPKETKALLKKRLHNNFTEIIYKFSDIRQKVTTTNAPQTLTLLRWLSFFSCCLTAFSLFMYA